MSTEISARKSELRQQLRAKLKSLAAGDCAESSLRACELLRAQMIWKNAGAILFYAPLPDEVDLSPLLDEALAAKKIVALPRFLVATKTYAAVQIKSWKDDGAPGKFGIHEPSENCPVIPLNHLDLVLAPGVGFDSIGHRLGRGQGFYDRLLAQVSGIKCGIAFDEQMVQEIPAEPHDVRLNCILTPTRWLQITS